jgi:hypothetical protein
MSLIERYEAGEPFGDLLAEADTKLLALENDGMELAAKLGDAEHQLQGAVEALERLADPDSWPAHARPHRHTVRFAQQALDNLQPGEQP